MQNTHRPQHPTSLAAGSVVVDLIETLLVDLPTIRPHKLSVATMNGQTLMLVRVRCSDGTVGIGEGTFTTCVADAQTAHPRQGYVTQHMSAEALHGGNVDVYLCGPPPMVEAVQKHFKAQGMMPVSFHYEKFTPNQQVAA